MNLQRQTYFSVSSVGVPIRNTADYSPFGVQLDGRTLAYVPPAPAPPSVTVVYQHKFDDNPSTHPYTTAPNQLNTKLTNVNWTNSQSSWTNFAGFTGKAIATNSATPDTSRLYLNLSVNSGFMLDVKSYSFYHRSSTTGYTNYQLLVNGVLVGSGSIFVSSGSTLQSTGNINVANAIAGLTGSVTVTLKLFGGSNGNNATFRLDDFTLNGYTQEVQVYAESYRRGFNGMEKDDEVKGAGNSYDFGARMYDARVGRWWSCDALEYKYPNLSPFNFVTNSPLQFIDPNGKDIEPKNSFKASLYYSSYTKLINGNSVYNQVLAKYKSSELYNFKLYCEETKVNSNAYATTYISPGVNAQGKIVAAKSDSYYTLNSDKLKKIETITDDRGHKIQNTYEKSEIWFAHTLLHEAIHALIGITDDITDDKNHNKHAEYRNLMLKGLIEYNKENSLGYSVEELEAFSWKGIATSKAFKEYITSKSTANGTTYQEEQDKWIMSYQKIQNKLVKSEDISEKDKQIETTTDEKK